ncbi:MAG: hypothetical protein JSV33_02670 [bacterium]|nr:MAG: hypothetical protein JSV33_02670 [bacterium]
MTGKYDEIDLSRIQTVPIRERGSKVTLADFGEPVKGGKAFSRWIESLPNQLAVRSLKDLVRAMRTAVSGRDREIIWMVGAHVVKCGLSRYIIELARKGYVTTLAMNGAGLIHDLEIASFGETSEDVARNLERGIFGLSEETARTCFEAVAGVEEGIGIGQAVGGYLFKNGAPHKGESVLAQCYHLGIPVTVHIAIGTDIIAQHPGFDGARWGEGSAIDFRVFSSRVHELGINGGVVLNVGSAVVLPEIFLKAFAIARNLGAPFDRITTCDIDMIRHYRPHENVLLRPTLFGGKAIQLTGHHEFMIPLLYSSLLS